MPQPTPIPAPTLHLSLEPLTAESFAEFGSVIESPPEGTSTASPSSVNDKKPRNDAHTKAQLKTTPHSPKMVSANQGTAMKYIDIANMPNLYEKYAPSGRRANTVINMFACKARKVETVKPTSVVKKEAVEKNGGYEKGANVRGVRRREVDRKALPVPILERHPFTSQMFVPLATRAGDEYYVVVVAPTLRELSSSSSPSGPSMSTSSSTARALPTSTIDTVSISETHGDNSKDSNTTNDNDNDADTDTEINANLHKIGLAAPLPDLQNIRAFRASVNQSVVYAAGTWHAPMIVVRPGSRQDYNGSDRDRDRDSDGVDNDTNTSSANKTIHRTSLLKERLREKQRLKQIQQQQQQQKSKPNQTQKEDQNASGGIDFVVVQYANGGGEEDCQEVLLDARVGVHDDTDNDGVGVEGENKDQQDQSGVWVLLDEHDYDSSRDSRTERNDKIINALLVVNALVIGLAMVIVLVYIVLGLVSNDGAKYVYLERKR